VSESSRVRIATCRDHAEAAVITSALRSHGIHVFVNGEASATMFSWAAAAIALDVWVDRDEADEALALIRELREGGEAQLADDVQPADDTGAPVDELEAAEAAAEAEERALAAGEPDTLTRLGKRKRTALALAVGLFIGHGTAHMSARAWKRGLVLAAVQVLGWRTLFTGNPQAGAAIVVATIAMDLVGALLHIAQTAPDEPPLPTATLRPRR
jgi:hypothetical protein